MKNNRKINVMHIIMDLVPGGAERVVLNYLKYHDRDRYNPMVCVLRHLADAEKQELVQGKIKYIFLDKGNGFKPTVVLKLVSILKRHLVHVLHLHNFSAILYGTIAGLLAKTKIIIQTEHNVVSKQYSLQSRIKGYLKCFLGLFCKRIIAVSERVNESQKKYNFLARDKFVTIYNGIDSCKFNNIERLDTLKTELGLKNNEIVITKIASLTEQKGHEILIQAAKKIVKNIKNVRFLIVGEGNRKNELTQLVSKKKLENFFIFTGIRNDVPKILSITDIFVLSSHWEGFPISILESMACGLPVVVTNVGGNSEAVIHGETGILVPAEDFTALSNAIIYLIRNKNVMLEYGKAGKERFRKYFTAQIMCRKTERLYNNCIAGE